MVNANNFKPRDYRRLVITIRLEGATLFEMELDADRVHIPDPNVGSFHQFGFLLTRYKPGKMESLGRVAIGDFIILNDEMTPIFYFDRLGAARALPPTPEDDNGIT